MGADEDMERIRESITDLQTENKTLRSRLDRLEVQVSNFGEKFEELKASFGVLAGKVDGLVIQIQNLVNLPAQKVSARWDEAVKMLLALVIGAIFSMLWTSMTKGVPS